MKPASAISPKWLKVMLWLSRRESEVLRERVEKQRRNEQTSFERKEQ